jgi:hypothetical protein
MKGRHNLLLISIGLVLLFIVGLSFEKLILESGNHNKQDLVIPKDNPPVEYNPGNLHEIFTNRPTLNESDLEAKKALITRKNPLQTTDGYAVEYLSAPDEFMVEIKTTDIQKAKADTVGWLESQGLSSDGICKLPVVFYLNYEVAQGLRGTNTVFSPLPPGC